MDSVYFHHSGQGILRDTTENYVRISLQQDYESGLLLISSSNSFQTSRAFILSWSILQSSCLAHLTFPSSIMNNEVKSFLEAGVVLKKEQCQAINSILTITSRILLQYYQLVTENPQCTPSPSECFLLSLFSRYCH